MDELPPIERDPRFAAALQAFNEGEFFDASEGFEDLFFEAVRDEVPFARMLLQLAVGCLHAERKQTRAACDRLSEALKAMNDLRDARGLDLPALRRDIQMLIDAVRAGDRNPYPRIKWLNHGGSEGPESR